MPPISPLGCAVTAALHAEKLVGRLSRVAFVRQQFAAELEDAAGLKHHRVGRRLEHPDLGDVVGSGGERLRQREPARLVETRIRDRRHVAALEADVRMQRVETGMDAGGLDLRQHRLQVGLAIGEAVAPRVVAKASPAADLAGHMVLAKRHQLESALLRVADELVDLIRHHRPRKMEDRLLHGVTAPARDATRQAEVALERIHRVEERLAPRRGDQRRPRAAQLDAGIDLAEENSRANTLLVIDVGIGRRANDADRSLFVPARVQPVAEVLPVPDGQLQYTEGRNGRDVHPKVVVGGLAVADEVLERKGDVSVGRLHRHLGLVLAVREADHQRVARAAERTGGIDRALVRMDQLDLVVEGPILGHREQRQPQRGIDTLFAGRLDHKRLHAGVLAHAQREITAGNLDIGRTNRARKSNADGDRHRQRRYSHPTVHFIFAPHVRCASTSFTTPDVKSNFAMSISSTAKGLAVFHPPRV